MNAEECLLWWGKVLEGIRWAFIGKTRRKIRGRFVASSGFGQAMMISATNSDLFNKDTAGASQLRPASFITTRGKMVRSLSITAGGMHWTQWQLALGPFSFSHTVTQQHARRDAHAQESTRIQTLMRQTTTNVKASLAATASLPMLR